MEEDLAKKRGFIELTLRDGLKPNQKARMISSAIKILDQIKELDLHNKDNEVILNMLLDTIHCPNYYKTEKAKKFVASIVHVVFFKLAEICERFKLILRNEKTEQAEQFGELCVTIWSNCDVTERSTFQVQLLKPIAECAILAETPQFSKNCRAFLEKFGVKRSRRKELWTALTHIYEPIVFRYLHAANPLVRDNSLSLFTSCAFPIESTDFTKERKEELMNIQIEELNTILMDDCPKVRANAAKAVCRLLYQYWQIFPTSAQKKFLDTLTKDLSRDGKSTAVRVAVLEGLNYLCGLHDGMDFVAPYIVNIVERLHDPSEQVRIAFIKLLNTVSTQSNVNIFKVIHIDHFIYRMSVDSDQVVENIVELLKPSMFSFTVKPSKNRNSEEDLKRKLNKLRCARCIYLCHRSLQAATKFYSLLTKSALTDDMLDFIHVLFFWSQKTASGDPTLQLPSVQQINSEECALPAFECEDDLVRLYRTENNIEENDEEEEKSIPEHVAVWSVISGVMNVLGKMVKDEAQIQEIREKTFPGFNAKDIFERLPSSLHQSFFGLLRVLGRDDDSMDVVFDYLSSEKNSAWSEALNCLTQWGALSDYLVTQTKILTEALNGEDGEMSNEERSAKITRSVRYLMFMFSTSEIRSKIDKDMKTIETLLSAVNEIFPMLYAKLGYEGGTNSLPQDKLSIAESLSTDCYVMAVKLVVTLRINLSFSLMADNDMDAYNKFIEVIGREVFIQMMNDIKDNFFPENIPPKSLQYEIFVTILTLMTDLISLHIFDGQLLLDAIEEIKSIASNEGMEGHELKNISLKCLSKITDSLAVDATNLTGDDHPAAKLLKFIIDNSKDEENCQIVSQLLDSLVKTQKKKRSIPWLVGILGDMAVAEDEVPDLLFESIQKCLASLKGKKYQS